MQHFTILPFIGAGSLRFGMTRDEVRGHLSGEVKTFLKTVDAAAPADFFRDHGLLAYYETETGGLEALEFAGDIGPAWKGVALLGRRVKAVLQDIDIAPDGIAIDGDGVTFEALGFGLYAPGWLKDDEQLVEGVIVFKAGYYALADQPASPGR
ncbi:MAG TPA: hypothetical protein VM659_14265 [Dongiaceae bacterium]|nr:hypothetical protein [Dongiaceae bacterium]